MSKQIVYAGQSLLDKAIECTGSIENLFEFAFANGLNITDDLVVGSELRTTEVTDRFVFNYFDENNRPATGRLTDITDDDYEFPQGEFPISL